MWVPFLASARRHSGRIAEAFMLRRFASRLGLGQPPVVSTSAQSGYPLWACAGRNAPSVRSHSRVRRMVHLLVGCAAPDEWFVTTGDGGGPVLGAALGLPVEATLALRADRQPVRSERVLSVRYHQGGVSVCLNSCSNPLAAPAGPVVT
jgi:hypothetical protein